MIYKKWLCLFLLFFVVGAGNNAIGQQAVLPPYIKNATIETIAGIKKMGGFNGDILSATGAYLNQPRDVAFFPPNRHIDSGYQ